MRFIQEEPHNITYLTEEEYSYSSAENAASRSVLCAHIYTTAVVVVVDAHITKYQVGNIRTMILYCVEHNLLRFPQHLAGPAVGLRTECTYLHKREGCTYLVLLRIICV